MTLFGYFATDPIENAFIFRLPRFKSFSPYINRRGKSKNLTSIFSKKQKTSACHILACEGFSYFSAVTYQRIRSINEKWRICPFQRHHYFSITNVIVFSMISLVNHFPPLSSPESCPREKPLFHRA